jgi:hypothetical protein
MLEIDTERTPTLKKSIFLRIDVNSQPRRGQGSGCERKGNACQKSSGAHTAHELSNVFPSHSHPPVTQPHMSKRIAPDKIDDSESED